MVDLFRNLFLVLITVERQPPAEGFAISSLCYPDPFPVRRHGIAVSRKTGTPAI